MQDKLLYILDSNSVIKFVIVHYAIISYEDEYLNKIFSFYFKLS